MQERQKKGKLFRTLFLKILPSLLIAWLIVYTIVFTFAVKKQLQIWQPDSVKNADTLSYSAEEWQLIREKAFLNAKIALAGNDSICMTINLEDSLVQIETKGVILRQIKFENAEISRFFRSFRPLSYSAAFSKPFNITEIEGTIVKEPIVVKKAPRDTIEAARNITEVDTTKTEFVEWHLQLDSAFIISFVQLDRSLGNIDWPALKYRLRQHYKTFISTNRDLLCFRKPTYYPEITIFIPEKEAKSFYRALPSNGQVTLKF